jgi:hypothetical protein
MILTTLSLLCRTAAVSACAMGLLAQTVTYSGVGGRHEQNLFHIQNNVPLPATTTVNVPYSANNRRIFVRFLSGSSSVAVTGFDIKMRFGVSADVVPAWIYTANAQNAPGTAVLTGQIGIGTNVNYCRASFPTSYTLAPNQLYFMAFQLPAFENVRFATAAASSGANNVTYFVTPTGVPQQATIQFGVHTGGFSPTISLQQPFIGQSYNVGLTGASIGRPAVLWFQLPNPGPKLSLAPFGAPGSFLYLDLHNMLFAASVPGAPNRQRNVTFLMPYAPSLIGQSMHFQWQLVTSDPQFLAGWVTSNLASCSIR